jgi:aryl-alcohol dehydrogenase-like predicted oxidoreductase
MKSSIAVENVDRPVSELVLGSAWFSLSEKDLCFSLLDAFAAHGGTAVDTARIYRESEPVIGQWMRQRANREQVFLITKGGLSEADPCRLAVECFGDKLERDLTESLEELGTDAIDLYLLHRDAPSHPVGPIIEGLNRQLESGRIRAFGGSNWRVRRIEEANEYADKHGLTGFAAVSNNLSLAVPTCPFYDGLVSVDADDRQRLRNTGIPLFSWSSQARGFFTGRFRRGPSPTSADLPKPDDAFYRRMLEVYGTDENCERLRRAEQVGKAKGGYSAVQVALAWVIHQPFRVFPLIGPHTVEELDSCVKALEIGLSEAECRWLNLEAHVGPLHHYR